MGVPKLAPVKFPAEAVRKALRAFVGRHVEIRLVDSEYACLTHDEWDQVIAAIGMEKDPYTPDTFDCDSFSRTWWAKVNERYFVNGMFTVFDFGAEHSYNLLLPHEVNGFLIPLILEPQNLQYQTRGTGHYQLDRGFLV